MVTPYSDDAITDDVMAELDEDESIDEDEIQDAIHMSVVRALAPRNQHEASGSGTCSPGRGRMRMS